MKEPRGMKELGEAEYKRQLSEKFGGILLGVGEKNKELFAPAATTLETGSLYCRLSNLTIFNLIGRPIVR